MTETALELLRLTWNFLVEPRLPSLITMLIVSVVVSVSSALRRCLDLETFYQKFHFAFSLLMLYSASFLIQKAVAALVERYRQHRTRRHAHMEMTQKIAALSPSNAATLKTVLSNDAGLTWLDTDDTTVLKLEHEGIITPVTQPTDRLDYQSGIHRLYKAYVVSQEARAVIEKHPPAFIGCSYQPFFA